MHVSSGSWFHSGRATAAWAVLALVATALVWYGQSSLRLRFSRKAAEQSVAAYDFPAARGHLRSCLKCRPNDEALLLLAAQAARRDGQLDEATEYLDRYRSATGALSVQAQLESVLVQVQRGEVKQYVHRLIEELEIRHPASEQILESLALGCVHVYRLDEASFWTKQLLERYPANPVGRLVDAQMQDTLRRREESVVIMRQLVEDYPRYGRARLYLADLLFRTNQYEEAVPYYRELHEHEPDRLEPLLGLFASLVKLERLEEARPLLTELQTRHADNSLALLEIGRFAIQENRPQDAEPVLRRAAELTPYDHEIHLDLATALERLGRGDESREHLARFEQIESDMKLLDAAFQAMVKAPNDPEPRLQAGRICLRNGQVKEGLRWLSGVLDLVPDHQATHEALADYYESEGEKVLARQHRVQVRPTSQNQRQKE
jgi:Flp pilus assembly protein TadD